MHDHPFIVLQAIQALKPHGLVRRISVHGRRVELHLEDGRILTREIPPAQEAVPENTTVEEMSTPHKTKSKRPYRKNLPKD